LWPLRIYQFSYDKKLNRRGGHLLLGVNDDGSIEGVIESSMDEIIKNLVTNCNNPSKLSPTFYLSTEVVEIDNKKVIYVYVPESSQVHNTVGHIFDRNADGDFDITSNHNTVAQLYMRKQSTFSENTIYPYLSIDDFEPSLFEKIRNLAKNQRANHPWQEMNNEELLKSSSLWKKDLQSGTQGYTLAAAVLLGKDEVIHNILPHYKTDAILRVENLDRYDDRDDIRCNLINAYSRLNEFVKKHLPDKFYTEGTQRVSLRDKIFREIAANLLVHREFTNHYPAKLIIETDRVFTENANKPHGIGLIDPSNFSPYPKNPSIAKFFKEIGWVDELGSGIRNTSKYCSIYNNNKGNAEFIEGDIFKTIIPLAVIISAKVAVETELTHKIEPVFTSAIYEIINEAFHEDVGSNVGDDGGKEANEGVNEGVKKEMVKVIEAIRQTPGLKANEIAKLIGKSRQTVERYIKTLRKLELLNFEGSPKIGGYYLTEKMKKKLNILIIKETNQQI
jgi:ATP-dependent DNA helicase RecG